MCLVNGYSYSLSYCLYGRRTDFGIHYGGLIAFKALDYEILTPRVWGISL